MARSLWQTWPKIHDSRLVGFVAYITLDLIAIGHAISSAAVRRSEYLRGLRAWKEKNDAQR